MFMPTPTASVSPRHQPAPRYDRSVFRWRRRNGAGIAVRGADLRAAHRRQQNTTILRDANKPALPVQSKLFSRLRPARLMPSHLPLLNLSMACVGETLPSRWQNPSITREQQDAQHRSHQSPRSLVGNKTCRRGATAISRSRERWWKITYPCTTLTKAAPAPCLIVNMVNAVTAASSTPLTDGAARSMMIPTASWHQHRWVVA